MKKETSCGWGNQEAPSNDLILLNTDSERTTLCKLGFWVIPDATTTVQVSIA